MILVVPALLAGERIDKVIATMAEATRHDVAEAIGSGRVTVGEKPVLKPSRRVVEGETIEVAGSLHPLPIALVGDPTVPFRVVYEDDALIVVDKPADVVVHPGSGSHTGTLVHGLLSRYPNLAELAVGDRALRPGIVHRIDKGTSGLLVVARTPAVTDALQAQLAAHSVDRRYLALAWGPFEARAGLIDAAIGRSDADPTRMTVSAAGRPSVTHYTVEHTFVEPESVTLVRCELETGRTHQIRVHLAAIGHPVVGDPIYGGAKRSLRIGRPFLHAQTLGFVHPSSGEHLSFDSPLPAELVAALDELSPRWTPHAIDGS
jgi:23S rRNA pseudouridine1911/1915/1917 synthase